MGPCRAWLPYFGCWAATALHPAAVGWVPSGRFGGWCLAFATAVSGFSLMGSLDGVWCAVFCGSVWFFIVPQCSLVFIGKSLCSVMLRSFVS